MMGQKYTLAWEGGVSPPGWNEGFVIISHGEVILLQLKIIS
jgi:hypothetical protein